MLFSKYAFIIQVIVSASCGIEPNRIVKYKPNVDEAITLAGADHIIHNIVLQRDEWFGDIKHGDVVYQVHLRLLHLYLISNKKFIH